MQPYNTYELNHFVDVNYDNYNFEVTFAGQELDICPIPELKIFKI